ncbi:hypothetical protein [Streptomyces marincola]|uniref:hypothetical protein n=1 Tax=Streptomyces marincola TaxID=2878388 RepID=UPI001CF569C3|nr:hypothetical protein [Streptomyces marincola]UCM87481.1 hypothetical protein LC193_05710 [Streptomyces marincola]
MPSSEAAAGKFQDLAALWSIGEATPTDVVDGACDALVAGLDSPALRMLAACTRAEAASDVPDLLPPALDELGLVFHPVDSVSGLEAATRVLAARLLAGELTPRELTRQVHWHCGHRVPLAQPLAALDDDYDNVYGSLGYIPRPEAEIDAEVRAEAKRLVDRSAPPPERPSPGA